MEQLEDRALLTPAPFGPGTDISTSADGVRSIVAADLDGDGDTDLISASQGDDEIIWHENFLGDGSAYIPRSVTSNTNGVVSVAVADIDGDGKLDIVSASSYDDKIAWFRNVNGDGTTFTEIEISIDTQDARSVFVVDIDDDGDLDVVTASFFDDEIAWHENSSGDGSTWIEHVVATNVDGATAVSAADMDGDGDIDIVASSQYDDSIRWFSNVNGDGSFFGTAVISSTTTGASSVFVADVDGDGDNDIVAAAYDDDEVVWFENNGAANPTFAEHVVSTTADGVIGVSVADIDNDGDNDILSASRLDDTFAAYENNGDVFDPLFTSRTLSSSADGAAAVIAADVDGDGDMDIVGGASLDDTITVFENETIHRGATFPVANPLSNLVDGAYTVTLGDFDGDGDQDIISSSLYDSTLQWFRNDTTDPTNPLFTPLFLMPIAGVRDIELYDVDQDGTLDILFASASTNNVTLVTNPAGDGSQLGFFTIATGIAAPRSLFVADLNGNGSPDILTASSGDDAVRWTEIANGIATTRIISVTADGARDVIAADVDGDGDMDVIVASYYDDRVTWYENTDGDALSWGPRVIDTNANGARTVDAADIDGDGDIDIVAGSTYDNSVRWYENDGAANPTFTKNLISNAEKGVQDVAIVDLDLDGDYDIVSVAEFPTAVSQSQIAYFLNDGALNPTFTRVDIDTTNDRPNAVAVGDIDRDGDADVVSTSMFDDSIVLYQNGGGQLGLATEDTTPLELVAGVSDDLLKITATHNGRPGDSNLELRTFELLLERIPGTPLTQAEANDLIFDIDVWLDDGDGIFDSDDDILVLTIDPLVVDADGILTIFFTDDDPNVQIELGTPRDYFVVVESTATAFLLNPKTFVLTHVTEASSTVEDAVFDIAGSIDFATNVSTPLIGIAAPDVPLPGIPIITAPIGENDDPTPTFTWLPPVGAEQYELMVFDIESGQMVIHEQGITGTMFTPTTPLAVGRTYEVFLQAINVAAEGGGFSTPEYFAIDPVIPVPAVPFLTGPAPVVFDTTPTITWTAADTAINYDLLIYNVRTGLEVINPKNVVGTSFTFGAPLPPDPYQVFVRAKNAGGPSQWSKPLHFNTQIGAGLPAAPVLTGPASMIPDNTPTITWTEYTSAVDYDLLMYSITKGQEVLNVTGIGPTEFTTPSLAAPDTYQVFVRAHLGGGVKTVYGTPLVFRSTSAAPIPRTPKLQTPTRDTTDGTPTFIWTDIAEAALYDVVAYNVGTGQQAFFANGQTSRHFTPGAALAPGFYQVHVRAVNSAGEPGAWSGPLSFRILDVVENDTETVDPAEKTDELKQVEPLIPADETVLVSIEVEGNVTKNHGVTTDDSSRDDVPDAAVESATVIVKQASAEIVEDDDSLVSVMTEWPETDWWNDDIAIENEASMIDPSQAAVAGAALGLALPAVTYYNAKKAEQDKAAPRRSNRRPKK